MSIIQELGAGIEAVAAGVGPSVVGVGRDMSPRSDRGSGPGPSRHGPHRGRGRSDGPGSAVVVADGRVLTALRGDGPEEVALVFPEGRHEVGELIAVEPDLGLALLAADTAGAPPVGAAAADAPAPGIGAPVFALADPGGRGLRATVGFVSAADRSFRGPRGRRIEGALEHTAPLPRGSSGGPLLDADGRLIGLNLLRREGGLILAVPAGAAQIERLELIAAGEVVPAPRLGVALAPARMARRMRRAVGLAERDGLLVRGVDAESPADRAGILRGDLLVAAGESELSSLDALVDELEARARGGQLELAVVRGSEELTLTATFDTPASPREATA